MYDNGEGVPQDDETAMKWFGLAAKQGNSDAQQRYGELLLEDFVYGSDVRALKDLGKSVETFCRGNFKCAFDKIWAYLDITGDGRLSLAEIARFQRNILKFGVLAQKEKVLSQKEKNDMTGNIIAINLASIIFLPITASSVLHSFDYNNDGLLSKGEVFGETEFAKLVGLDADTLMGGVNFETLSKQLQEIRDLIPFPFLKWEKCARTKNKGVERTDTPKFNNQNLIYKVGWLFEKNIEPLIIPLHPTTDIVLWNMRG